jgi:hypothetical protein
MGADDDRLARTSRVLRRRLGMRQVDVTGPRRNRRLVIRLERGEIGSLRLDDIRSHFAVLGGRVRLTVWWNGAALDRLLDERHAQLVERVIALLRACGWSTLTEVTYSEWGERGSIDVLAAHQATQLAFVGEVKSEWGSIEETNRRLDAKVRLAPKLVENHFGWRPTALARVLILPDEMTARRIALGHRLTLESAYPARGREVRAWIRRPTGDLRGLWFLSEVRSRDHESGR